MWATSKVRVIRVLLGTSSCGARRVAPCVAASFAFTVNIYGVFNSFNSFNSCSKK